ncbi:TPA: hypothetical protein I8Y16_005181 [Raoultella ornithinolytica]|nr:hypothetical protein [Raoultella ornithinolytica]HAT1671266.1 hypothetical protein [Raoultella ornithinolytica]
MKITIALLTGLISISAFSQDTETKNSSEDQRVVTYVRAYLDENQAQMIKDHLTKIGITDTLPIKQMHSTILYSKTIPTGLSFNKKSTYKADVTGDPEIIGKDPVALILNLKSDDLKKRNSELMRTGGTSNFPSYKIHMSVKYNPTIADLEALKLHPIKMETLIFSHERITINPGENEY